MNELHRYGNFSSSEIYKLVKSGRGKNDVFSQTGLTYIAEKRMEKRLGRSLSSETNAKPTNWGTFLEGIAFEKLSLDFSLVSKKRFVHTKYPNWVGMPDNLSTDIVADIKCPWTMKQFCELVDAMKSGDPYQYLKSLDGQGQLGSHYIWQLVSNAILCDRDYAALFVYVPYKSDLDMIRYQASQAEDQNKVAFIQWAKDDELPYLPDDCEYYKDFNTCTFEIPQEDKDFLTERVVLAIEMLNG